MLLSLKIGEKNVCHLNKGVMIRATLSTVAKVFRHFHLLFGMNSGIHSTLLFMRSSSLHLSALNWFLIQTFDEECAFDESCTFAQHENKRWIWSMTINDYQWLASILTLFANVVVRMCLKTLMVIWKAWYHPFALLSKQCLPCQCHAIIRSWHQWQSMIQTWKWSKICQD